MTDARVAAWLSAWNALEAATKADERRRTEKNDEIRDEYTAFINEMHVRANAFTALASVAETVGWQAGEMLEDQAKADRESYLRAEEMKDAFKARRDEPGCTCDWSRASCPVHPWPPKESND